MTSSIHVTIADFQFELFADRGMYWHDHEILFIADTHFGKEATFRRHGIPVPVGSTDTTLAKIASMLRQTDAHTLCILGDMFHARSSLSVETRQSISRFLDEYRHVRFLLVRGNHDIHVGLLPAEWPIELISPGTQFDRLSVGHHPLTVPTSCDIYLCGHLHPSIRVGTGIDSIGRFPCFWHSRRCMVLPAIGDFTGTHPIRVGRSDQAWFIADGELHPYRS